MNCPPTLNFDKSNTWRDYASVYLFSTEAADTTLDDSVLETTTEDQHESDEQDTPAAVEAEEPVVEALPEPEPEPAVEPVSEPEPQVG